ncbi:hypothetical protein Tco_0042913 [Tanacetum coccineum]
MKNLRMTGSMNGTKIYHGLMRNLGLTLEYGRNRNESKILASLSTIKLDVRNGRPVAGERMTKDIIGFKTYEDYKDYWIYEWNENVPWVYDKPWLDNGIWKEPKRVKDTCKPFNYKTGCSEWSTCSWREDGYCNGGNLPKTYHIGNSLHYQDFEWYEALEVSELKDEALRNKAIMEGLISDDESSNDC